MCCSNGCGNSCGCGCCRRNGCGCNNGCSACASSFSVSAYSYAYDDANYQSYLDNYYASVYAGYGYGCGCNG